MKYIITESKLENFITNYIEDLFSVDEINWANPRMYDPEEMESYEDPNLIEYYIGDYEEGDNIFLDGMVVIILVQTPNLIVL